MGKVVKEAMVTWEVGTSNIVTNTDLPDIILSVLQQVSPDFVMKPVPDSEKMIFIYKDMHNEPRYNPGWILSIHDTAGSLQTNYIIWPEIIQKKQDGTFVNHNLGVYGMFADRMLLPNPVQSKTKIPMRISVYEGKHKKCWAISVTKSTTPYDVWSAIVGIDSSGLSYAIAPTTNYMNIISEVNTSGEYLKVNGLISSDTEPKESLIQEQIGISAYSSQLTLMPYVNPVNGAICNDLYLPINGPRNSHIFNVTLNGRNFVTAARYSYGRTDVLDDDTYVAYDKIFMEV